jgi:hypothetical protein
VLDPRQIAPRAMSTNGIARRDIAVLRCVALPYLGQRNSNPEDDSAAM